jgi:hypothetical protein
MRCGVDVLSTLEPRGNDGPTLATHLAGAFANPPEDARSARSCVVFNPMPACDD